MKYSFLQNTLDGMGMVSSTRPRQASLRRERILGLLRSGPEVPWKSPACSSHTPRWTAPTPGQNLVTGAYCSPDSLTSHSTQSPSSPILSSTRPRQTRPRQEQILRLPRSGPDVPRESSVGISHTPRRRHTSVGSSDTPPCTPPKIYGGLRRSTAV